MLSGTQDLSSSTRVLTHAPYIGRGGGVLTALITRDVSRITFRQVSSPKLYPSINFIKPNLILGLSSSSFSHFLS